MIEELSRVVVERAIAKGCKIATAESCTGGLIAAAITDVPGSSEVLDRGFVTYSNEAKVEMLKVSTTVLENHGAVSAETARAMVSGALAHSHGSIAVAVTGIAGPGGGSAEKPVGLVYIASQSLNGTANIRACRFTDEGITSRTDIRRATVQVALEMVLEEIDQSAS